MKARKKDSNDEWKDVAYVQLEGSDILYKEQYLEFDTLSTEIKTNEQIADEKHWQDVRERAAIAAMKSMISAFYERQAITTFSSMIVEKSVIYADTLVKQLKGE